MEVALLIAHSEELAAVDDIEAEEMDLIKYRFRAAELFDPRSAEHNDAVGSLEGSKRAPAFIENDVAVAGGGKKRVRHYFANSVHLVSQNWLFYYQIKVIQGYLAIWW